MRVEPFILVITKFNETVLQKIIAMIYFTKVYGLFPRISLMFKERYMRKACTMKYKQLLQLKYYLCILQRRELNATKED